MIADPDPGRRRAQAEFYKPRHVLPAGGSELGLEEQVRPAPMPRGSPRSKLCTASAALAPDADALDLSEIRKLLAKADAETSAFLEAMVHVPLPAWCRGAAGCVGDYDAKTNSLTVMRDKAGKGRQIGLLPEHVQRSSAGRSRTAA